VERFQGEQRPQADGVVLSAHVFAHHALDFRRLEEAASKAGFGEQRRLDQGPQDGAQPAAVVLGRPGCRSGQPTQADAPQVPFTGPLGLALRLAEHIEAAGLTPIVAHPERSEEILERPDRVEPFRERGWLLQANATSLLGYHGRACEAAGWRLVEEGAIHLVASDGHRAARPPFLDGAYEAAWNRVGEEAARGLFDGSALEQLVDPLMGRHGVDLTQRR